MLARLPFVESARVFRRRGWNAICKNAARLSREPASLTRQIGLLGNAGHVPPDAVRRVLLQLGARLQQLRRGPLLHNLCPASSKCRDSKPAGKQSSNLIYLMRACRSKKRAQSRVY